MVNLVMDQSGSSDSSYESDNEVTMPTSKPEFGPVGQCDLLHRVRDFIPRFLSSTSPGLCDPIVTDTTVPAPFEMKIPKRADCHTPDADAASADASEDDDSSSVSSYGVEVDLGLGVFDVNGEIDESTCRKRGIEVVDQLATEPTPRATPLIQEMSSENA